MLSSERWASSWLSGFVILVSMLQQIQAYRPVQHCKTIGDNGHYSACTALTQHYNTTTGSSDLYLRYNWFRWRNSKNGWHSFAIGQQMAGAFMLLMYGDPNTPSLPMTISIRTSEGHAPPRPLPENERLAGSAPEVEVVTAVFEEYKGNLEITSKEKGQEKPTHVGIAEVIIRNYEKWDGFKVTNTSAAMDFIWASNFDQDMNDDFSAERNIDMHQFGRGFGFLYVDMLNAVVPEPMFGPIDELAGLKGAAEAMHPPAPTPEELTAGAAYIEQQKSGTSTGQPVTPAGGNTQPTKGSPVEQPVRTVLGKTLRDWMWHLHGFFMCLAFLGLYPFGTYLIRSGSPTAFNLHWTVQGLATVALGIGSIIGYVNSRSISIKHQYIGIFMVVAITAQIVLGWRHHMYFVATKRKNWLSKTHIYLGRVVLPLGYVNIILGMLLRQYGWFTITLVLILIGLEIAFLTYILLRASKMRASSSELRGNENRAPVGDDAEEYFQLDGEDEFSDSDDENNEDAATKQQAKKEQSDRLRRLDKV